LLSDVIGHVQSSHPIVLVLDDLDECETDSQGREGGQLLLLLARSVISSTSSVKSLVTSRLEPTIRKMFDEMKTSTSGSEVLQLHDMDRTIVRNDIRHYLEHSFRDLVVDFKVAADWPSQDQVEVLLNNADVLFIYVATVIRYIRHRLYDPRKRLEQVLSRTSGSSKSAYRQLDIVLSACA
jgi:hypothetical protein